MIGPSLEAKGGMATVIKNMYHFKGVDNFKVLNNWQENHRFLPFIKNCLFLRKKIRDENIDIVHFHVAQKGSFYRKSILLFLLPKKIKTIFHMHASQFDLFYQASSKVKKNYIRKSLNRVDLIVAVSENWKHFYKKITDTQIDFINNAVEVSGGNKYQPESQRILTLGRIGERKGTFDLIEVAKRIGKKYPNITFEVYGDGEIDKLKDLTAHMPNIKINGWINQKKKEQILQNTLLHFLPSYNEGLPMAILETMSCGIPNIATTVGGIPQLITDNEDGFLVKPGEIEIMCEKILHYLEVNQMVKTKISKKATEKIKNNYSLESYMSQWHNHYIRLMEKDLN